MAAYDLQVQRPNLLQIPTTFNRSAQTALNAVRVNQEQKNLEDKLALASREQALQERKQTFNEGAGARAEQARIALNKSMENARVGARDGLAQAFQFDQGNRAAIENDARYLAATEEQRQNFWDTANSKIAGSIGKHTSPREYETALRAQFAETSATPEQIDAYVSNEMAKIYGTGGGDLTEILARSALSGGGTGSSGLKPPRADDPGNTIQTAKDTREWVKRNTIEGSGSWLDSLFGDNLNERDFYKFADGAKANFGVTDADVTRVLESYKDDESVSFDLRTAFNGSKESQGIFNELAGKFNDIKRLRNQGVGGSGNSGNNVAQAMQIVQAAAPRGTTVTQRRDLLFSILADQLGPAEAKKQVEKETDLKVPDKVVEEAEKKAKMPDNVVSPSDLSLPALQELILGNSSNHRNPGLFNKQDSNSYNGKPFLPNATVPIDPNLAKGLAEYLNSGQ
ncbi:hypothetical protein vBAmePPT11V19_00027 [Alteromonas phage vB_AmeP_PT11-V19]|nr:hypothetical protein vBAmePPT11V19_00027 [Alteromonas phage vB_AmeP_PT11-V19]